MHIYPKPQIYIGLGEKNKLKCWEERDHVVYQLNPQKYDNTTLTMFILVLKNY